MHELHMMRGWVHVVQAYLVGDGGWLGEGGYSTIIIVVGDNAIVHTCQCGSTKQIKTPSILYGQVFSSPGSLPSRSYKRANQ